MSRAWIDLAYLIAAVLFIVGLMGLTKPRTAVRGNRLGSLGMLIAIVVTLFDADVLSYGMIILGLLVGSAIGAWLAQTVKMEAMPGMVALLNGFGGGASFMVAGAEFLMTDEGSVDILVATPASGLIGAVTLLGSLVAFAKLGEFDWMRSFKPLPAQNLVNIGLGAFVLLLSIGLVAAPQYDSLYWLIVIVSLVLGYTLTIGIGGADMPVVIALLNSYSGLAGAATGFVLQNNVLIIAGSLVGASGVILTKVMCDAMNRSLIGVLFGTLGPTAETKSADEVYATVKATSADEVAMLLDVARRVVVVPGYGLAVAQAQHAVLDLMNLLLSKGIEVEFGIHPVAGRMPGHMNVLLAEADIPYNLMKEMDDVNASMEQTDVCLVIGANDTVNPDGRTNPKSPIAGMPIINADKARTCVVVKRSLSPGFAGIPNPLFAAENTLMLYADGKQAVLDIIAAVKAG